MPLAAQLGTARAALRIELPPMLRLALPVVVAELGWMAMSVVDTMMVGRLSPEAIGAVSIGSILFYTIGIFGTGMLLGLDTLIPQAFGAGNIRDCHRSLIQAVWMTIILSPLLAGPIFGLLELLPRSDLDAAVVEGTIPYTRALLWSTPSLLLYMAVRHYLQGMNLVRPIMFTLITANVVNIFANWVFIFGNLGARAYGVAGAGWASCASRVYMLLALAGYMLWHARKHQTGLFDVSPRLDPARIRALAVLSFPAAMQRALEIGVFAVAAWLVGLMGAIELAAHQVALQAAAVSFMVPMGISSAAAVRVGQALGRRDAEAAHRSGWTALALGGGFMACAGLVFLLFPQAIIRLFSADAEVLAIGVKLLYIAALFQLFDGLQVVATGALRGAGDTRSPMISNLLGHWFLGLPVGYFLGFHTDWGPAGVWIGLCLGLIAVGSYLAWLWSTRLEAFRSQASA